MFASAKLKESSKSRFDNDGARNIVSIISHITFQDYRVHIFFRQPFSKQLYIVKRARLLSSHPRVTLSRYGSIMALTPSGPLPGRTGVLAFFRQATSARHEHLPQQKESEIAREIISVKRLQFLFPSDVAAVHIIEMLVIARCPQGERSLQMQFIYFG